MEDSTSSTKHHTVMCAVCAKSKAKLNCEECDQRICFDCRKSYHDMRRSHRYDIICKRCLNAKVLFYYKTYGTL